MLFDFCKSIQSLTFHLFSRYVFAYSSSSFCFSFSLCLEQSSFSCLFVDALVTVDDGAGGDDDDDDVGGDDDDDYVGEDDDYVGEDDDSLQTHRCSLENFVLSFRYLPNERTSE